MPKSTKRSQAKYRARSTVKMGEPITQPIVVKRSSPAIQVYDGSKYIKSELLWSSFAAGIVVILLVIAYIFLR
jgi:hypothetical protein